MSEQELLRFTKELGNNENLRSAAAGLATDLPAIAALAKENGFDFTLDELEVYRNQQSETPAVKGDRPLTDEELSKVSGAHYESDDNWI